MTTPQELKNLFRHSLDLLVDARIEEWIDLFTEDGILEFPYPAWGLPVRMQGREELLAQMTMFRNQLKVEFSEPEFYTADENGLVITAYTGECTLLATGGQYHQTYLSVVRFRHDRIALYRDFWAPWALMQAAGGESLETAPSDAVPELIRFAASSTPRPSGPRRHCMQGNDVSQGMASVFVSAVKEGWPPGGRGTPVVPRRRGWSMREWSGRRHSRRPLLLRTPHPPHHIGHRLSPSPATAGADRRRPPSAASRPGCACT